MGVSPMHERDARATHGRDGRATGKAFVVARASSPCVACASCACSRIGIQSFTIPLSYVARRHGAHLPHWTAEGAIYSVTFRLADALPASALEALRLQRNEFQQITRTPTIPERLEFQRLTSEHVEHYLDRGSGECWLQRTDIAEIVAHSLTFFEGKRYELFAWCIMPNHVHVILQPLVGNRLPQIIHTWKSFSAKLINMNLHRRGKVWQTEYYDHIIRNDQELDRAIEYVWTNPEMAGLRHWKWRWKRSLHLACTMKCGILPPHVRKAPHPRRT